MSGTVEGVASVGAAVRAFVLENFYVEERDLSDETSLIVSGIVDSTGMLEVIAFLEGHFGIQVEDREAVAANLETVGRIAAFVASKLDPAAASAPLKERG